MVQVGFNQSFTDQNTKGLPRNWFQPRRPTRALTRPRTQPQAGQVPWSQSQLSPGLQTPGDGDVPSYWPSHETQAFGDLELKQHLSFSPL